MLTSKLSAATALLLVLVADVVWPADGLAVVHLRGTHITLDLQQEERQTHHTTHSVSHKLHTRQYPQGQDVKKVASTRLRPTPDVQHPKLTAATFLVKGPPGFEPGSFSHLELAAQAVNNDLQVELTHALNHGLAGLLVTAVVEGGVLLGQLVQAHAHLLQVTLVCTTTTTTVYGTTQYQHSTGKAG